MDDVELIKSIRLDSLSKHDGMTRRYASLGIETCRQVIINRTEGTNIVKVVFEEHDGYGHGLNVPPDIYLEDHIAESKVRCARCKGAGKLSLYGIDCTECNGTGKVAGKIELT